jgi:GT2 family glycosyltransferase
MTRLSVIMPAYNCRRFVREAVNSILAQTFTHFEFIIIDDGSTDGTTAELKSLAASDARIRLISRPNTGYTKALIEAMSLATAPLIARMDADDVSMPERFALQVAQFDAAPDLVLLGGSFLFIDDVGRRIKQFNPPADHKSLDQLAFTGGNPFCHPLVMFRRDAYDRVGGYDPSYEPSEDIDLWLKMAEAGRISCLPDLLLLYRQHAGSVSEQRQKKQIERIRAACEAAAMRRGIAPEVIERPWRPTGSRSSAFDNAMRFGWWAYGSGSRDAATHYAWQSIKLFPWKLDAWKLLYCGTFKMPKKT